MSEQAVAEKLREQMAVILKQPVSRLDDSALLTDLVCDSFVLVDMVIELQEEFDIILVQEDLRQVKTVGDLIGVFEEHAG